MIRTAYHHPVSLGFRLNDNVVYSDRRSRGPLGRMGATKRDGIVEYDGLLFDGWGNVLGG